MQKLLRPIQLDESSSNVQRLHAALAALGMQVPENERLEKRAGEETFKLVRELQKRLKIRYDDSVLVDSATITALNKELKDRGVLEENLLFTVNGKVIKGGLPAAAVQLMAFDMDLKGAAVYRTVKSIDELKQTDGFEFLDETTSGYEGLYSITFYPGQFTRRERKKADVVVYAVNDNEIIGRSRLVNAADYSITGEVRNLDVVISKIDNRTEYEAIMTPLGRFLEESGVSLVELGASSEQVAFTVSELDLDPVKLSVAVAAEIMLHDNQLKLPHELLYGLGRQGFLLLLPLFYNRKESELQQSIAAATKQHIIRQFKDEEVQKFIGLLLQAAIAASLDQKGSKSTASLGEVLSLSLPEKSQQTGFLTAIHTFKDKDPQEFWSTYLPGLPEFKDKPQLIEGLLFTHQLTMITGNHLPLISALQKNKNFKNAVDLLKLSGSDWEKIVKETGVPEGLEGRNDKEKAENYAVQLKQVLQAAYPTQKIGMMLEAGELPVAESANTQAFLAKTPGFDFKKSRVHDFKEAISRAAGKKAPEVTRELMRLQRIYQVSPSPEVMPVLLSHGLDSARSIASIPRKSFIKMYGNELGGETVAFAVHEKASFINTRSEMAAMTMMENSHSAMPAAVMGAAEYADAVQTLQNSLPNYSELFGSPDVCECEHCRSVYGAAAYFMDLLRFLWRGLENSDHKTPLDMLALRRPDLLYMPLTCENTDTIIPYIDLVNEVMEHYTVNGSLNTFKGFDTGDITAEELRASPQNVNTEAYRILDKEAVYPFTLPYHQPLDVIRTYGEHLQTTRKEVMVAMQKDALPDAAKAIAAEALKISPKEFTILAKEDFATTPDPTPLHEYFGYASAAQLEAMAGVREFLARSGIKYTDLVELVLTKFINPHQDVLDFLQDLFADSSLQASQVYDRLAQIDSGTLEPAGDADIMAALTNAGLAADDFKAWVQANFAFFNEVITLYEPASKCDLDTTVLRTVGNVYSSTASSGMTDDNWSRVHRFIRLWKKLGLTIHETDLLVTSTGETDITPTGITKLSEAMALNAQLKKPVNELVVLWGDIDTFGKKSLYKKLFLNKTVLDPDPAFAADELGNYFAGNTEMLTDHLPAILAAFRMSQEDLDAIISVAQVIDATTGNPRLLDVTTDALNLHNLSVIYRFAFMSKALKYKVPEFCLLMQLMGTDPFSTWNNQANKYTNIDPAATLHFYELAKAVKKNKFSPAVLQYIFSGALPADSSLGLDPEAARQAAKTIRNSFAAIEQDHPDVPPAPLTADVLRSKLSLTFQPEVVNRLMGILDGTVLYDVVTTANLAVVVPAALATKYAYIKASGRITATGTMTDAEKTALEALDASAAYTDAIDALYKVHETFLTKNFSGVFSASMPAAFSTLLDHPTQPAAATLEEKLLFVYVNYLPLLKRKLREDAITQHIAALTGLTDASVKLLAASNMEGLVNDLAKKGLSATYFNDAAWTTIAAERLDDTIDFNWSSGSPDPAVPADVFSARWEAYVSPLASGEYTLAGEVDGADESFKIFVDDVLVLEKPAGNTTLAWEVLSTLNASQLHRLRVEYAEGTGNAGMKLFWKTATTAAEPIPVTALYPSTIIYDFVATATIYHRSAKFITGFGLDEAELAHFITYNADFSNIDFTALTASHWKRISDYVLLRASVPQAQARLIDVFKAANTINPAPTVNSLRDLLALATAWDSLSLDYLVNTHFGLNETAFKNEEALLKLYNAIQIVARTGISVETVAAWGLPETDFDRLHETALLIRGMVKARYEEEDWLNVAGKLSDKIREAQKQALISHLLTKTAIQDWGARDADGLFEYFLIDVQMGACMDTSRIVQANAAVQMFVNRCLLNLESDKGTGAEKGVSPEAVDADRWEWMKAYRVWEANRKVFLYPENWLEPEWRNDRSVFFKELESELVQNDITDRSVDTAFRNYLTSLNEVANLDVVGMYQENETDGKLKLLHVFGRTHNAPYKLFYRTWNKYEKWSAWEKVQADVRNVEEGDDSGVHLVPVVWKNRLFLFWPEFIEKSEPPAGNQSESVADLSTAPQSTLQSSVTWEVRLAWTENVEGRWTPKQLSKEHISTIKGDSTYADFTFSSYINKNTNELSISMWSGLWVSVSGWFKLTDIQSKVEIIYPSLYWYIYIQDDAYKNAFEKRAKTDKLILKDDSYLNAIVNHKLLGSANEPGFENTIANPFFYQDATRTYFVKPVEINVLERISNPTIYIPFIPEIVDDSWYHQTHIPHVGPDDYLPGDIIERGGFIDPVPFTYGRYGKGEIVFNSRAGVAGAMNKGGFYLPDVNGSIAESAMFMRRDAMAEAPAVLRSTMAAQAVNVTDHITSVGSSFGNYYRNDIAISAGMYWRTRKDTGLEFHSFYHPVSHQFVTNLNQKGISGLLESDTTIASDEGSLFTATYSPVFSSGFIQKPADFSTRTYFKENVCFDVYGANSLYNWELFFHAPLYIAVRLSKNGRYEEAMKWFHYIFNPTTDEMPQPGQSETSRFWQVLPFKTTAVETLESFFLNLAANNNRNAEDATIGEWRDNPFDPHLVASNRPIAYMKNVVIKYVENLLEWGDSLFRQFTRESVYEALQLYVMANHVLGPRPEFVPKRGEIKAESYDTLKNKLDDFSNAVVQLENIFPFSSEIPTSSTTTGGNLLGIGESLYFCIPDNDKLMECWDKAADRLYKIRHCMDINGVERKLALFAPPIDPAALIQATSQGLSLGSILADLSSPPPIYRFTYLVQRAYDFCSDVKVLGNALLLAFEKKDVEELSRLQATHEKGLLDIMTGIKERQVLEARAARENLGRARVTAEFRVNYYRELLGNESITVPVSPAISTTLTVGSPLPPDTVIAEVVTDADVSLVDSGEGGIKLIGREKEDIDKSLAAKWIISGAGVLEAVAGVLNLIPQLDAEGTPLGVGAGAWWGGQNLGAATSAVAKAANAAGTFLSMEAASAQKMAGYIRREQDWVLQLNLAAKEIIQLDKQITTADIRVQITEKELDHHLQQIANVEEVRAYLQNKFTSQELYQWMKEQLFAVYKQSFNMSFDMAKKAEKCYKYETGNELASFIQYGYWDNAYQGLLAGEKLGMALRQMEKSYLEENKRELEMRKNVSLAFLNPLALQQLRQTGSCMVTIPEEAFDMDFQGHYFRRLKSVSLSIPCITGPLTTIGCTLRLLKNSIRTNTSMNEEGNYEHMNDEGVWIDDDRFRSSYVPVQSIAISNGQTDAGLFELFFMDDRYLPFEGAGAISDWKIELTADADLRQFDYDTISDVIIHLSYTAREDAGLFKDKAVTYLKDYLTNFAELSPQPLIRMFSLRHEFSTEWYRFLNPPIEGSDQEMKLTLKREHFPFFTRERSINVMRVDIMTKTNRTGDYRLMMTFVDVDEAPMVSSEISMPESATYGDMQKATLEGNTANISVEDIDVFREISLKLKHNTDVTYHDLNTDPLEVEDVFIVIHYKLSDLL